MVVLSSSILMLNNSKIIDNINNFNDNKIFLKNNVYILFYISLLLIVTALPAVLVALHCNPNNKFLYGLTAFLFSDVYLLQWSIKKFILNKANYCK